jgi:hypothetical protein
MRRTSMHVRSAFSRHLAILTSAALVCVGLTVVATPAALAAGPPPIEQRSSTTVTADPLPTVQIDSGVVWTQVVVGDIVYAGGKFDNTRPAGAAPGQNLTPRGNLLAYNIKTGALVTNFAPKLNGQVKVLTVSPDKKRLYVGGQFTKSDNDTRFNIAAYDLPSGALVTTWKPAMGGSYVNAIAASNSTVYVGGLLSAANGVARKNLAAVNASDGKLTGWNPTTDRQVDTMVLTPNFDKVIVGGRFAAVNNVEQKGLVALSPTKGEKVPWAAPNTVKNGLGTGTNAGKAGIYSLSTDGASIFGTGWVFGGITVGNLEGSFKAQPGSGAIDWLEDCHGDTYSAYSDTVTVYEVSHKHDCVTVGGFPQLSGKPGNMRHAAAFTNATKGTLTRSPSTGASYADWSGQPAPAMIDWFPEWVTGSATGQGQAAWTVTGAVIDSNNRYVVVGGEFPYVNGVRQQGLVRFATPTTASNPAVPKKEGPRLAGAEWAPTLQTGTGSVRLNMAKANWDRDDLELTYRLVRDGVTLPTVQVVKSTYWNRPALTFLDTGQAVGSTHSYRLTASDQNNNKADSATVSIVVK